MAERNKAAKICEVLYGHRVSNSIDRDALGPDSMNTVRPIELEHVLNRRREWININPEKLSFKHLTRQEGAPRYLLTFDDGYRDNITTALPIVEAAGVHILIFITTDFINGRRLPTEQTLAQIINSVSELQIPGGRVIPCKKSVAKLQVYQNLAFSLKKKWGVNRENYIDELASINCISHHEIDRKFLSWEEVNTLDRHPLVTIGAHSVSHPCLTSMRPDRAYQEIIGAKIELEQRLGHIIHYFSYPYGSRNFIVDCLVRRAGFRYGFATERSFLSALFPYTCFSIPRINLMKVVAEYETTDG